MKKHVFSIVILVIKTLYIHAIRVRPVSVSAETYFSIGADTCSSFTCLNSQHCCMHGCSFKPIVCPIHFET